MLQHLEQIKPRQLVLLAHVTLDSNPFIVTARKRKAEERLLRSVVLQRQVQLQ